MSRAEQSDEPIEESSFQQEQERLSRTWTFLGLTADLTKENDWFRAQLGSRSVFVQRFGSDIVGFENVCAHRFYPLRTHDKGNGPIICGFHRWHYDRRGHVVGVPICKEVFGVLAHDVPAKLRRIEVATCGAMVFGRLEDDRHLQTLEEFLGDGFPILASITRLPSQLYRFDRIVEANWRLMMEITLDEYHGVAVHQAQHHMKLPDYKHCRFGMHSALFGYEETLEAMAEDCRADRHRPAHYRILNFFPNLAVSLFPGRPYWYVNVQQFVPISSRRSRWRGWVFAAQFPSSSESRFDRLTRFISEPIRARLVLRGVEKIGNEDHAVCERLQEAAWQAGPRPILSNQETRIGWFREAYARAIDSAGFGPVSSSIAG